MANLFVLLKLLLLTSISLLTVNSAFAVNLPKESLVPGGIALLELGSIKNPRPSVFFNNDAVAVVQNAENWIGVIGIPLSAKVGKQTVEIVQQEKKSMMEFSIVDKAYRTQEITVKDKRKVNPNEEDMKRINSEKPIINNALKHWRDTDEVSFNFRSPVEGVKSSSFGSRRIFNGQARSPHSGMDIAAAEGSPITAPAAGKIIEIGDYFFNGKTVFVDHGQGLVSMYCHMSDVSVQKDQWINAGDKLGKVGKTGRVTGAHLHWGVSLNDTRVDPQLFLSE